MQKDLVEIGIIVAAHGIKGEVKVKTFTAEPKNIAKFPKIFLGKEAKPINLKIYGIKKDQAIAMIEGVSDRNGAEALSGYSLYVKRSDLPKTKDNEFYQHDLIGAAVKDEKGKEFGQVLAFHNFGGGDLVEIKLINKKTEMFMFNKATFPEINKKKGILIINPPEEV